MPDVEVTVTTNPIDVYINSDPNVYIDTSTQGVQGPSAPTGDFVSKSETGLFYPASNPSGFVTSDQPIFAARPQVDQGGNLLGLAYITEVGDKLPNPNDFGDLVKWNGNEWIAQKIDYSEIQNPPPIFDDRLPLTSNDGDALFWTNEVDNERWIGRQITVNDISGTGLFYPASNPLNFVTSSQLNDVDINNTELRKNVVYITGLQVISGSKLFNSVNAFGLYYSGASYLTNKYTLVTAPGNFALYNYTGVSNTRSTGIYFLNDTAFNIYGSGQSAIKLYEKLITGFDNINSKNFISDYNGSFGWSNLTFPNQSSRFTSKDGGGYWVTLDRADGSPENLNVAGNLQVGSGSGIPAQRLFVRGNALITTDLTVNTSGNFLSGLFVNRNPVLTGTTGTQSQINNLSTSLSGSYVTLGTNQTITGNKIFDSNVFIKNLTVTGTQTVINTEAINVASNYINLNATGGVRDGGLFINFSSNSGSGAYLGWDIPSNTWRFGSGVAGTDLATLDYIASQNWVTGIINDPTIVRTTGIQTITDYKSFGGIDASEATVIQNFKVGYSPDYLIDADGTNFSINILNVQGVGLVLNSSDFYLGGPSGNINFYNGIITGFGDIYQNSYRVVDSSQTGSFLTNASNVVYLTGNQTISGLKTFANNLEVSGYGNFSDNLYINNSRVATEAELTKKMIAFAIALG